MLSTLIVKPAAASIGTTSAWVSTACSWALIAVSTSALINQVPYSRLHKHHLKEINAFLSQPSSD